MDRAETKHTPSPWELGEWDHTLGYDCMTGGIKVGPVYLDGSDYGQLACRPLPAEGRARLDADARLISAAPDLLEALTKVVEWNGMRGYDDKLLPAGKQCPEIADAMRAIAKAEGLGQLADATKESPHV
jgi:hypothetical protein